MTPGLEGKVALVTGGSRGIGAETAARLAEHGALVGVGGRDRAAIDRVVDRIRAGGGQAVAAPADATDAGPRRAWSCSPSTWPPSWGRAGSG
jgi:3-oxoacyl-[acyl-carrier protein] reductase